MGVDLDDENDNTQGFAFHVQCQVKIGECNLGAIYKIHTVRVMFAGYEADSKKRCKHHMHHLCASPLHHSKSCK